MKSKLCKECNSVIILKYYDKRQIFCNHSCATKYNNRIRGNFVGYNKCKICNKNTKNKNTCDTICYKQYLLNKTEEKIINGKIKEPKFYKRYLIKKFGHKCFECKMKTWKGKPIPIELDHKDGNSENNNLNNLRLLCLNCHGLTPTWKAKNMGKGRKKRYYKYIMAPQDRVELSSTS